MKNFSAILNVTVIFILAQNVFAANVNLGEGNIGSGTIYPVSAALSLNSLNTNAQYDITCKVSDPDAKDYPVMTRFDISTNLTKGGEVFFDGQQLPSKQAKLSDNNEHTVTYPGVITGASEKTITLTWLESKGVANPVHYNCTASLSIMTPAN